MGERLNEMAIPVVNSTLSVAVARFDSTDLDAAEAAVGDASGSFAAGKELATRLSRWPPRALMQPAPSFRYSPPP